MLTTEYDDDAANRWELCDCAVALFSFDYCRYLCVREKDDKTTTTFNETTGEQDNKLHEIACDGKVLIEDQLK